MIRIETKPEKILEDKRYLVKHNGKNMVLNQVNLTIKAGEIYGLVGRKWCKEKVA